MFLSGKFESTVLHLRTLHPPAQIPACVESDGNSTLKLLCEQTMASARPKPKDSDSAESRY